MRASLICLGMLTVGSFLLGPVAETDAALTAAQRRQLSQMRRDLGRINGLVRQEKFDEAEKIIDEAEAELEKIAAEAELSPDDRAIAGLQRLIDTRRTFLNQQRNGEGGRRGSNEVSFEKDVAPILLANCISCHSDDPRGGLRLNTFAGMKQGGASGPLAIPGNANRSMLALKLIAPANQRMPRGRPALPQSDIQTIANWINQGAKFDGEDETARIGQSGNMNGDENKPAENVVIAKATGDETVSFVNDIAPFMVNLCVNCHSGNNPRGGLSLVSFEDMMRGGESGRVVLGGNLEGSRLFRLVGGLELPRMPQGQARITRKNYEDLRTWVIEGAKFDGEDPKTPLRELVPTAEEMRAAELARLSPEEFNAMRLERSEEQWERVLPKQKPLLVESQEFFVMGNVPEPRLKQVSDWAEEHVKNLRSMFGEKANPLWKGKLAVFVMKERFDYEEFNLVVERRQVPREVTGHSRVDSSFEQAYVVLQDIGDDASEYSAGLKVNLADHLTGAFLKRSGTQLPDWVIRGTGMAIAAGNNAQNEYIRGLRSAAAEALKSVNDPESIFADGTFSPSDIGAVGYTLVDYMLKSGGAPKFGQFISALQNGNNVGAAVQSVYRADLKSLGTSYYSSLQGKGRSR